MEALSSESFAAILALVGVVIVVAALLSGFIERSNFPQVAAFLALGAVLGPSGLGLLQVDLNSPILRVVATLSLALVLFTDALSLNLNEVKKRAGLALLVLGPGTLSSAALISFLAWWLLGLPPAAAIVLGAALASTDPVLLRGLLRFPSLPNDARVALRLESGLNDVVLLPIVLVAMIFMGGSGHGEGAATNWVKLGLDLFLIGPLAGILVGLLGVATLDLVRRRIGIRRDYESLYSLGIAFAAFAAAETVHGSGFLAVFMAGLTISALDVELCDCFREYGETTAELALLFTFVLLGSSLIWSGFPLVSVAALLFALGTIFSRPITFLISLLPTDLSRKSKGLIAWFGPRGLSSLLLVLLPVFAGVPGSDRVFSYCCLVVILSVAVHGGSLMFLGNKKKGVHPAQTEEPALPEISKGEENPVLDIDIAEVVSPPAAPISVVEPAPVPIASAEKTNGTAKVHHAPIALTLAPDTERITLEQLDQLQKQYPESVLILDARSHRSYLDSDQQIPGAIRIDPDRPVRDVKAMNVSPDTWIIAFCACPNDKTSVYAAGELREAGFPRAHALTGGWDGWLEAGRPVEAKSAASAV
jgi:NhaP-type Na+/H+ or K+/H+ antiporter/rhodanese-related sulfurtransferase